VDAVAVSQQVPFETYITDLIQANDGGPGKDTGENEDEDAIDYASERAHPPTSYASSSDPLETESVQQAPLNGSISPFYMAFGP
jgi:hypothetical protein